MYLLMESLASWYKWNNEIAATELRPDFSTWAIKRRLILSRIGCWSNMYRRKLSHICWFWSAGGGCTGKSDAFYSWLNEEEGCTYLIRGWSFRFFDVFHEWSLPTNPKRCSIETWSWEVVRLSFNNNHYLQRHGNHVHLVVEKRLDSSQGVPTQGYWLRSIFEVHLGTLGTMERQEPVLQGWRGYLLLSGWKPSKI